MLLYIKRNHQQNEKATYWMGEDICKYITSKGLMYLLIIITLHRNSINSCQVNKAIQHNAGILLALNKCLLNELIKERNVFKTDDLHPWTMKSYSSKRSF